MWVSPHHPVLQHFRHQLGVQQFTSVLILSTWSISSHKLRAQPQNFLTSDTNRKPQVLTCSSEGQALYQGFHDPLLKLTTLQGGLQIPGNTVHVPAGYVIRGMTQSSDDHPDEFHRVRSGRVHGTGAAPRELGRGHPPSTRMCSSTRKLSEPCILGVYMETSSQRHDRILTQSLEPLLPDNRSGAKTSQLLITLDAFCDWLLSGSPASWLISKQVPLNTQDIPRALAALCKILPPAPFTRKLQRV